MRLTWVTPVFEAETDLLLLQARSFAQHLATEDVAALLVIDNSARGMPHRLRTDLEAAVGHHAPALRVLRPDDVCAVPAASGWRRQQVLKLAIAREVPTPHYVVLDAKNHFVARPGPHHFVAADGRSRVRGYGYDGHPLRPALVHVLRTLGLDPAEHVGRFTATVTPFVLDTAAVRDLVEDVESTYGAPFGKVFVQNDLTEFFLYAGWLLRRDGTLETVIDLVDEPNAMIWPRAADLEGVRAAIRTAVEHDLPVLGVHRNAVPRLPEEAVDALARFWSERGLVDSVEDGRRVLTVAAARHGRQRRLQQARDLAPRARTVLRRLRARAARPTR